MDQNSKGIFYHNYCLVYTIDQPFDSENFRTYLTNQLSYALQYVKMRPSLKAFRGIQPNSATLSGSQSSNSVAAASESGSTTSESET